MKSIYKSPHPIKFERIQDNKEFHQKMGLPFVPFESFCDKYFESLPGDQTFLDYRKSIVAKTPQAGISATDAAYACWRKPRVYMIEDGIGELLLNTKLGDIVELRHFNLPFDTIYLDLPRSEFTVSYLLRDGRRQEGELDGAYIIQDPMIAFSEAEIFKHIGQTKIGDIPVRPLAFILVSKEVKENISVALKSLGLGADDCLFSFPVFLKEGPLRVQIDERIEQFIKRNDQFVNDELKPLDDKILQDNLENFRGIFEWIVNILLYITMPKSRIDKGKGNQGIPFHKLVPKKQRKTAPTGKVFVVGRGIKISHLAKKEPGISKVGSKGIKRQAHWVSGHFRSVPYGPRKIDGVAVPKEKRSTRMKWILPYPRGEGSEYFRNIFQVTE